MKKIITLSLALIGLFAQADAQWNIGAKIGTHISNTTATGFIDDIIPMDWKSGLEIGVVAEKEIGNNLSVISGVNFSRKGFSINQGFDFNILGVNLPIDVRADANLNYIETPVALKYKFGMGPTNVYVIGGATTSYATSGRIQPVANILIDINLPTVDINFGDNNFSRWNVAAVAGVGVEHNIAQGKLFADIQYKHGLSNVITDTVLNLDVKNKGFSLGMGYAHRF